MDDDREIRRSSSRRRPKPPPSSPPRTSTGRAVRRSPARGAVPATTQADRRLSEIACHVGRFSGTRRLVQYVAVQPIAEPVPVALLRNAAKSNLPRRGASSTNSALSPRDARRRPSSDARVQGIRRWRLCPVHGAAAASHPDRPPFRRQPRPARPARPHPGGSCSARRRPRFDTRARRRTAPGQADQPPRPRPGRPDRSTTVLALGQAALRRRRLSTFRASSALT